MTYKNDSIDWIDVREERMRRCEKESKKMQYEEQPTRMPSADWFREKLGVSQGLAERFEGYCNPDETSKAIREYREKNGLSDDVPLCNEIRDVLERNNSILQEIMDSVGSGNMVIERALQVYKLEGEMYGISLFKVFDSLTPMKTYTSDQLGMGSLEDTVHKIINLVRKDPRLKLIVQRNVAKEINKMIIENALKEMELQEEVNDHDN